MSDKFPKFIKSTNVQVPEAQQSPRRSSMKRTTTRCVTATLPDHVTKTGPSKQLEQKDRSHTEEQRWGYHRISLQKSRGQWNIISKI